MFKMEVINSYAGHFLAFFSGLVYGFNGVLIKLFDFSFIEAVFIRCLVQVAISGLGFFLHGCNISTTESNQKNSKDSIFKFIALQVKKNYFS